MTQLHGDARSVGRTDADNEDAYLSDDQLGLYIVADGDGGAAAGEVASRIAVDSVRQYIDEHIGTADIFADYLATRAVQYAFQQIYTTEQRDPELFGMNTTLTLVLVRRHRAVVGHVGDSRLYLVRDADLHQLTIDHDLTHRTVGNPSLVEEPSVDTFRVYLQPNDTLVLCTDGLNDVMLEKSWIVKLSLTADLKHMADAMLARAERGGGGNDATVVLLRAEGEPPAPKIIHYLPQQFELFHPVELACA